MYVFGLGDAQEGMLDDGVEWKKCPACGCLNPSEYDGAKGFCVAWCEECEEGEY